MSEKEILDEWHKRNCFDCGGNCLFLSMTANDVAELLEVLTGE